MKLNEQERRLLESDLFTCAVVSRGGVVQPRWKLRGGDETFSTSQAAEILRHKLMGEG